MIAPHPPRILHWSDPRSIARSVAIRPRFYYAAIAGVVALILLPGTWSLSLRGALAWDISAAIYLASVIHIMLVCTTEKIRARAARQDDSGVVILVIVLLAITMSFVAITGVLADAKQSQNKLFNLGLAGVTIVLAWTVTQVVFTLHYAHEFYRPSGGSRSLAQGLDFRGDRNPDYWDFLYFATSIGAASQTSDVSILSKPLRRLVTLHAILSFFFNTAVLALTINLAASMI